MKFTYSVIGSKPINIIACCVYYMKNEKNKIEVDCRVRKFTCQSLRLPQQTITLSNEIEKPTGFVSITSPRHSMNWNVCTLYNFAFVTFKQKEKKCINAVAVWTGYFMFSLWKSEREREKKSKFPLSPVIWLLDELFIG